MNPPKVYELTIPSNHKTRSITAIVQSIVDPFRASACVELFSIHRVFKADGREYRVSCVSGGETGLKRLAG